KTAASALWFRGWRLADIARRAAAARSKLSRKKKRPRPFSPGRLGSPPPELPNHEINLKIHFILCKRHFSNPGFPAFVARGNLPVLMILGRAGPIVFARFGRRRPWSRLRRWRL